MLSPCQSPQLFPNNLNSVNVGPWKTATKNTTQKNSPSKFWIDSEREWERIRESRHLSTHISGTWSWPTQCWTLSHMEATSVSLFESSRWAKLTARGESLCTDTQSAASPESSSPGSQLQCSYWKLESLIMTMGAFPGTFIIKKGMILSNSS